MTGWVLWRGWIAGVARHRIRNLALVALAIGIGGGFTITAVLGAQRAESSWSRLRAATRAQDLLVSVGTADEATTLAQRLGSIDEVGQATAINVGGAFVTTPDGVDTTAQVLLGLDSGFGGGIYRPVLLDGRRPRGSGEVLANRQFLSRSGLSIGDSFEMTIPGATERATLRATATVVGEARGPIDETFTAGSPLLLAHRGLWEQWRDGMMEQDDATYVVLATLRDGVDPTKFLARDDVSELTVDSFEVVTADRQREIVDDAIRVQSGAFLIIGVVAGVVAAAGAALLISLEVRVLLAEHRTARALGADRLATSVAATFPFLIVGAVAGIVAAGVSAFGSRWVPVGLPRRLEPSPGPWVVPWTLTLGAAGVLVVSATAAFITAGSVQRQRTPAVRSRSLASRVGARFGSSPAAAVGVAATGGGFDRSSRGPARTAVAAAIAGTLLVTAVATVHRATEQVTEKPELAGYPFDLEVGGFDPATWPTTVELLTQSDRIAALTLTEVGIVSVDGHVQQAGGFDVVRGTPLLTVVDGRLPVAADEIAVAGVSPLRVGSRHTLSAGSSTEVRVVGRVIIELGDGASSAEVLTRLDVLSSIEAEMLTRTALVGLDDPAASAEIDAEVDDVIHGRSDTPFVCGEDLAERFLPELAEPPQADELCLPVIGVAMYNTVDVLPLTRLMTVFLALVGCAVVGPALVLAGGRRRKDVAVLRSLGFDRRQVVTSSVWWGLSVAVIAVLVGIALGVATGRPLGRWIAGSLGVAPGTSTPWLTLAAIGAGILLLCVVVCAWTGVLGSRRPLGRQLKVE